jgi:hypothetical protein
MVSQKGFCSMQLVSKQVNKGKGKVKFVPAFKLSTMP